MNRHLYGEAHGRPVKVLRYTLMNRRNSDDGVVLDEFWRARVIDDELYLQTSADLYHDKGRARTLRQYLEESHGRTTMLDGLVCHHVGVIRALKLKSDSSGPFEPVKGSLMSCRHCFTDYRIDVQWRPRTRMGWSPYGWVIRVTRWHQLGSCRSPQDSKWFNYATKNVGAITAPRVNSCTAGMVYRRWRGQDAEGAGVTNLAGDDGRFVELSR
ncbi:hypothetical protein C8A03DRAFT_31512 [Achaetomium macrosporum]|uniref:Uncharacterized protein n=1 Tax=Achaetomium macrosporum TaxID=79813 RepID=A0AAN7H8S9_9PEZI|nr:hypothetical protein C8A03DRAFT_31512 [Achaetomium macrosporum]